MSISNSSTRAKRVVTIAASERRRYYPSRKAVRVIIICRHSNRSRKRSAWLLKKSAQTSTHLFPRDLQKPRHRVQTIKLPKSPPPLVPHLPLLPCSTFVRNGHCGRWSLLATASGELSLRRLSFRYSKSSA